MILLPTEQAASHTTPLLSLSILKVAYISSKVHPPKIARLTVRHR